MGGSARRERYGQRGQERVDQYGWEYLDRLRGRNPQWIRGTRPAGPGHRLRLPQHRPDGLPGLPKGDSPTKETFPDRPWVAPTAGRPVAGQAFSGSS
ncbi:hypothetical protein [Streptomyces capitiformicae]|uniref:Uncharacterized protein n=1 Tax=Streptomyces capitiformicae TaxID=2014920 RepID=A0A918ZIG2_9ACTN|nr:hypothetical protein [Streptomyces capitiformicae]GHE54950.1 hypothetical protein GCM10017771_77410 [Streptomyces capitiformicae]